MVEPVSLTVGTIAALAFTKFLESTAGEAAKKLTPAVIEKMDALRQKIWNKLRGIPAVDALNNSVDQGAKITDQQLQTLTPHLEAAMKSDPDFAQDLQQIANQINQEINIGEILGKNIQNVCGGTGTQVNDASGQVFSGNITGGNFYFGNPPQNNP